AALQKELPRASRCVPRALAYLTGSRRKGSDGDERCAHCRLEFVRQGHERETQHVRQLPHHGEASLYRNRIRLDEGGGGPFRKLVMDVTRRGKISCRCQLGKASHQLGGGVGGHGYYSVATVGHHLK